ncbi:MAG: hypothetical protein NTW87_10985 [Planctomycetota bacterium]|nr:hypothetical protein [Planctomycetota bacterium]
MSATLAAIADGVVTRLNAATLSQAFTAIRTWQPSFALSEMQALKVTVAPHGRQTEKISRSAQASTCQVDVAVQKKLAKADNEEIDALVLLVEEIGTLLEFCELPGPPKAVWVKTENVPVVAQEHLAELRQFTSVLTLTFKVLP